jgi:general secretion pathway protein D
MSLLYGQNTAQKETNARIERTVEAQQLLMQGDVAYSAGKHAEAAEQFLKARNLLPAAPNTMELRDAATERYATATVQAAAHLSRKGDVAGAKQLIEQVLKEDVAPRHPGALAMRDQLNDPIRTNPAITKEHAKDIDEVRRTLYEADGFVELGKFDMAKTMYEDVLRIDPTNKAARRGMEKVAAHQSDYAKAASDQTRAQMLQEVDALWETPVPTFSDSVMLDPTESNNQRSVRFVTEQLRTIIFPSVDLEGVGIEEAVDFIRQQSRQLDTTTTNPLEKGFNIVMNLGRADSEIGQKVREIRFDLKLKNVPVETILKYICDQTRTQYNVDEFAINIRPLGSDGAELVGRTYKVPPDFLSADTVGAAAAAPANPFEDAPEEGLSAKRMTALERLRDYGVSFPDGAKASYNAVNSTLFVLNTALNHDLIQQVVDTLSQTEPVQVVIRVTMIKVQENELKELGFDWLFGNVGMGGTGISSGSDALFLGGGTQGNGAGIDDILLSGANSNPVTAGNRSGDSAIEGDSIDAFIQRSNLGFSPPSRRAPGVISLLSNDINGGQALMLMRGLNQKKGTDFMTCPATVARSGQTSKIEVIQELIYPSEYEPPELPQQVGDPNGLGGGLLGAQPALFPITPATPTAFEKRNVGVTLEVSPVVSADRRYIELALKPEMVTFDGFVNYGTPITSGAIASPLAAVGGGGVVTNNPNAADITPNRILQPIFSVVRSDTSVTIADGATIVLGGMVEERMQNVEDQVPILGSMPFVGRLFQSKARQPIKRNVIIMVNVELQDPSGRPYRNR